MLGGGARGAAVLKRVPVGIVGVQAVTHPDSSRTSGGPLPWVRSPLIPLFVTACERKRLCTLTIATSLGVLQHAYPDGSHLTLCRKAASGRRQRMRENKSVREARQKIHNVT